MNLFTATSHPSSLPQYTSEISPDARSLPHACPPAYVATSSSSTLRACRERGGGRQSVPGAYGVGGVPFFLCAPGGPREDLVERRRAGPGTCRCVVERRGNFATKGPQGCGGRGSSAAIPSRLWRCTGIGHVGSGSRLFCGPRDHVGPTGPFAGRRCATVGSTTSSLDRTRPSGNVTRNFPLSTSHSRLHHLPGRAGSGRGTPAALPSALPVSVRNSRHPAPMPPRCSRGCLAAKVGPRLRPPL